MGGWVGGIDIDSSSLSPPSPSFPPTHPLIQVMELWAREARRLSPQSTADGLLEETHSPTHPPTYPPISQVVELWAREARGLRPKSTADGLLEETYLKPPHLDSMLASSEVQEGLPDPVRTPPTHPPTYLSTHT